MSKQTEILFAHAPEFHSGTSEKSEPAEAESVDSLNNFENSESDTVTPSVMTQTTATVETIATPSVSLEQIIGVSSFSALFLVPICFWVLRHRRE